MTCKVLANRLISVCLWNPEGWSFTSRQSNEIFVFETPQMKLSTSECSELCIVANNIMRHSPQLKELQDGLYPSRQNYFNWFGGKQTQVYMINPSEGLHDGGWIMITSPTPNSIAFYCLWLSFIQHFSLGVNDCKVNTISLNTWTQLHPAHMTR